MNYQRFKIDDLVIIKTDGAIGTVTGHIKRGKLVRVRVPDNNYEVWFGADKLEKIED